MPIRIYIKDTGEELDWLCDKFMDLPNQIDALESWLSEKGKNLKPSNYVADIGFEIRKGATGGGAVINSKSMKIMGAIGMDVYFSECPSSDEIIEKDE